MAVSQKHEGFLIAPLWRHSVFLRARSMCFFGVRVLKKYLLDGQRKQQNGADKKCVPSTSFAEAEDTRHNASRRQCSASEASPERLPVVAPS